MIGAAGAMALPPPLGDGKGDAAFGGGNGED
jgi:hypothetical protein